MTALRWIAVLLMAVVGGYWGHRLTGNWFAMPIGAVALGFATDKLFTGEWLISVISLVAGVAIVFQFIGSGPAPEVASPADRPAQPARDGAAEKDDAGLLAQLSKSIGAQAEQAMKTIGLKPDNGASGSSGSLAKDCTTCPELVAVPAGEFLMGSGPSQGGTADGREGPQRKVAVRSFYAGRYAVTRRQFADFVQATKYTTDAERNGGCFALKANGWAMEPQLNWRNPGFQQADDHPSVCTSWNDAQAYLAWLNTTTRQTYRLLSEAEREYATRAGSATAYWWGDSITPAQANYNTSASAADAAAWRKATVAVNQFAANAMGLYNVHGTVSEWVQDCQHDNYQAAPSDGSAWTQKCVSTKRMMRGGGWVSDAAGLRSASRAAFAADLPSQNGGFRVARN